MRRHKKKGNVFERNPKLLDKFKSLVKYGFHTNDEVVAAINAYIEEENAKEANVKEGKAFNPVTYRQVQYNRPLIEQEMEAVVARNKARRELIKKYANTLEKDPDVDALSLSSDLLEDMLTRIAVSLDNENVPDTKAVRDLSLIHKSLTESKRIITQLTDKIKREVAESATKEIINAMKNSGISDDALKPAIDAAEAYKRMVQG